MNLTDEQHAIIGADPGAILPLVVTAFAGTGKTFTLEKYARARPGERMLYAAFNKAIQLDAERRMPSNVMSRTTHSLAYRACGIPYRKSGMLEANVPVWRIAQYLGSSVVLANFAFSVVKCFLSSADKVVTPDHIPGAVILFFEDDGSPMPPLVEMATGI